MHRLFCILLLAGSAVLAADGPLYNPKADANAQLDAAVADAARDGKHVLAIVGGNWCSWCKKLDHLFRTDKDVAAALAKDYVLVHVNFDKENKNEAALKRLEFPQRFGFPVLVVLDGTGRRLHTQNSGDLEEGKGHSAEKVRAFLEGWTAAAVRGETLAE